MRVMYVSFISSLKQYDFCDELHGFVGNNYMIKFLVYVDRLTYCLVFVPFSTLKEFPLKKNIQCIIYM